MGKGDGSQTAIVNFDNRSMRSLPRFLNDIHEIPIDIIVPYYQNAGKGLLKRLPIRYHQNDPAVR